MTEARTPEWAMPEWAKLLESRLLNETARLNAELARLGLQVEQRAKDTRDQLDTLREWMEVYVATPLSTLIEHEGDHYAHFMRHTEHPPEAGAA